MRNKRFIIIYCLLCLLYSCTQKTVPANSSVKSKENTPVALRILCYNIHHANPPSVPGKIDMEAIAKVIRDNNPDLVALQEVDVFTNRSGKTLNQAAELSNLSNLPYYYFAKAIDYDGGEYGVAILSKHPMEEMKNTNLPTEAETMGEPRTLATAVIRLPQGEKIVFASTHLDAQRQDTNRYLQINKIVEVFKNEKLPIVIAGDFNAVPNTRVIQILDKHFTRTCVTNCGFTVSQINPIRTIDFIGYRPSNKFTVLEHKVVDEKYASDHLPVLAVLKIK